MAREFNLAYGKGAMKLGVPDGVEPMVILPKDIPALADPLRAARETLEKPVGTAPLLSLLKAKNPEKITVVVNDETRPTPYDLLFPPLLEVFAKAGIKDEQVTFLIATGIHKPQSPELCAQIYGSDMTRRFRFINHVGTDKDSLIYMGKTSSGYDCWLNRHVVETDFLITLGVVMPHYFAGFSGGRKSILPGVAGHDTVEKNHARMVELLDALPPIEKNPVSQEMIEVARKVGVDFIIATVANSEKKLAAVYAGDLVQAWMEAVRVSASMYEVPFKREVDICVTSACGYPRDVNVYQAQKALDHAERITRPGGTIIWVAQCPEGYGEDVFVKWLDKRLEPAELMREFRNNFELGGHKAYAIAKVAARNDIQLVSEMTAPETELMFASKPESLQAAFDAALAKYGPDASVAILPQGSLSLPRMAK